MFLQLSNTSQKKLGNTIPFMLAIVSRNEPELKRFCKMGITQVSVLPSREKLRELQTRQEFIPGVVV